MIYNIDRVDFDLRCNKQGLRDSSTGQIILGWDRLWSLLNIRWIKPDEVHALTHVNICTYVPNT